MIWRTRSGAMGLLVEARLAASFDLGTDGFFSDAAVGGLADVVRLFFTVARAELALLQRVILLNEARAFLSTAAAGLARRISAGHCSS
jgi:hypothetical protein